MGNPILTYQNFLDLITVAELTQLRCYINCDCSCDGEYICDWPCDGGSSCSCDAEPIVCEGDCSSDVYCDPDHGF